jgi:hypothetical protein
MKIVPYDPRYRSKLLAFLAQNFPAYPRKCEPAYFDWLFDGNPLGATFDTYQLLVQDDDVVGQIGSLRCRLRVGDQWVDGRWIIDLVIDPRFRGGLAARQLFKRAMSGAPLVMATGVATHVVPIYNGLGWKRLSVMRARYSVLRPSRLLALAKTTEAAPETNAALRLGIALADRVLPFAGRVLAARPLSEIEQVTRFDPDWDADIHALTARLGITEYRSAAVLNWRFVDRPIGTHRIVVMRSRRGLRGMMVVRWMTRPGIARWVDVVDYLVDPDDHTGFDRLTGAALAIAGESSVDFVRFRLSHPSHTELLRRPLWIDHTRPMNDDLFAFSGDQALVATLESSKWHLTALASDRCETGRDE